MWREEQATSVAVRKEGERRVCMGAPRYRIWSAMGLRSAASLFQGKASLVKAVLGRAGTAGDRESAVLKARWQCWPERWWQSPWSRRAVEFEAMEHEGQECGPGCEVHIAGQGADVIKEGLACAQGVPNLLVSGIGQAQRRVQ